MGGIHCCMGGIQSGTPGGDSRAVWRLQSHGLAGAPRAQANSAAAHDVDGRGGRFHVDAYPPRLGSCMVRWGDRGVETSGKSGREERRTEGSGGEWASTPALRVPLLMQRCTPSCAAHRFNPSPSSWSYNINVFTVVWWQVPFMLVRLFIVCCQQQELVLMLSCVLCASSAPCARATDASARPAPDSTANGRMVLLYSPAIPREQVAVHTRACDAPPQRRITG